MFGLRILRLRLDAKRISAFFFFFFLLAVKADLFNHEQCIRALFMDSQISLFINFFIKNGSHDTIHTFKNYFVTVFFSFQFSAVSKWTLNRASYCSWRIFFLLAYSILLCHFFCSLLCVIVCVCGFFFPALLAVPVVLL